MTISPVHRFRTIVLATALAPLAACGSRVPAVPADAADARAELQQVREAQRNASKMHSLAVGKLLGAGKALAETCRPRTFDDIRLTVSHSGHAGATFLLDFASDAQGTATATWHVFPWDAATLRYATLPPRASHLDGATWWKARQLVADARFFALEPVDAGGLDGATWVVESCLDGHYTFVQRWNPDAAGKGDFERVARGLVEIGGSVCRLPGAPVAGANPKDMPPC